MFIEELQSGQEIKLVAKIGEEEVEFVTTVQEPIPRKHSVITDAVRKNEKVVTFHGKGLIVDVLVNPSDSAPLVFKNVSIVLTKKVNDDSFVYVISTITEAKVLNRRKCFRTFVGKEISVQCGSNHAAYDAVLKDISATGFAVVMGTSPEEPRFRENQVIHTLLNDYIEDTQQQFSFQLYGIIVRIEETDNGKIIYGCKLNTKTPGIEAYVMLKERIRIRNEKGTGNKKK